MKAFSLFLAGLTLSATASFAQVDVTATGGVNASYINLGGAFAAINAGSHTGTIDVAISASITEGTTPATLNSSGAGGASYASIVIHPTADGITIFGNPASGFGVIQLNGADNVTIDGDNPGSGGINRNLTVTNTVTNTTNYSSVIRVALATTVVTSADNCTFKNLILLGSGTGRNISTATSTTGSENNTYGILATGGASTVSATTAPSAIASVTTTIGSGATASNLTIQNNSITTAARAVAVQGSATTVFPGLLIENNAIGNSTAGAVDQVYSMGVTAQGSTNAIIRGNTAYVESFLGAQVRGLEVGSITTAVTGATFERNQVLRVRSNNGEAFGAYGINLGGGNNHIVRNNFVNDVRNDQTAGTPAFDTTFGAIGIRVAAGTGHKVYHNSVHLFGVLPGATSTDLTMAFAIVATSQTGMDVRNNIFSNQLTGGNPTSPNTRHVAIFLPSGGTSAMNLTLNNNDYVEGTDPNSRMAQVGTTAGTGEFTAADFDPAMTTPATNFRSYSSTLSAAGTNDNASKKVDPLFVSNTDLHIAVASPMVDMGASVGVTTDIDMQSRVGTPDIGADEPSGTQPANDIAATAIITPATGSIFPIGAVVTPQASFTNAGTATQTGVTVEFTITGPGGYAYSDTETIATINSGHTLTVTFAAAPAFTTTGTYSTAATVTTADANAANDQVTGSFQVFPPLNGTYNVPGDFPSLTNAGGIFAALNGGGATGNITINIAANLAGETGANALNELAGGFTVLIKPSGVPTRPSAAPSGGIRTISGSSSTGMIPFNGADFVTIDGSAAAGTDRSLTVTNTGAGSGIAFGSGAAGAQNNIVKNVNVIGGGPTTTLVGIAFGGNAFNTPGADNDNNRVENCNLQASIGGIFSVGASAANKNTGTVITGNEMTGTGASRIGRIGMFVGFEDGIQITQNVISGIASAEGADAIGIAAGTQSVSTTAPTPADVTNAVIDSNSIGSVQQTNTSSAVGIALVSGTSGTNTVSNNMISGVIANSTFPDIVVGIYVLNVNGATQRVYFNSVSMTGARGATADQLGSFALALAGGDAPADVRDNILYNTQTHTGTGTTGNSYAYGINSATFLNLISDYNVLFVGGAQGMIGITGGLVNTTGTDRPTFGAFTTATGKDANSISADPLFLSTTDLHIGCASPAADSGTPLGAVPIDIDGDPRSATAPDIGADEIAPPLPISAVSLKAHGGAGLLPITLPLVPIGGAVGIECRSGGMNGDYQIVITFPMPVTYSTASVTAGTGSVALGSGSGTNTLTFDLTGVTDVQRITLSILCVDDAAGASGDVAVSMGVLIGDVNGGGSVNASDIGTTKARAGLTVDGSNFRSDVVANGNINATDISVVKAKSGNTLPP